MSASSDAVFQSYKDSLDAVAAQIHALVEISVNVRELTSDELARWEALGRLYLMCREGIASCLERTSSEAAAQQAPSVVSGVHTNQSYTVEVGRGPQPRPRAKRQRKPDGPDDFNVFGRVTRLLDDECGFHSTLGGGVVTGWHPDVVPFSEMDEVPGLGWLMRSREQRRRHA